MKKPKLKVGDTFVYTKEMNDAKLNSFYNGDAEKLIGQKIKIKNIDNSDAYEAAGWTFIFSVIDDHLNIPKTDLDDVEWKDVLVDEDGDKYFVAGRAGSMVWLSRDEYEPKDDENILMYTILELKDDRFKFFSEPEEETVEVTMEEVCEKFGKNVKIKKE